VHKGMGAASIAPNTKPLRYGRMRQPISKAG
jgi:hypothetical protein